MDKAALTQFVKDHARRLGFDQVRIASAGPVERAPYARKWIRSGQAGTMDYLGKHLEKRLNPQALLPGARSVIVLALSYHQPPRALPTDSGRIAMYAWGRDYHKVIKKKLHRLLDILRADLPPFDAQACVDTAPVLEREFAMRAGIGWIGKNTLALNTELGSYFFLGEIVSSLDLAFDAPATDHCGSCTRCLDACPTAAFTAPYQMDARRCISYHTIELRGDIPEEFHSGIGDWLFGCDVCQEVCPFNQELPTTHEAAFVEPEPRATLAPREIADWSDDDYRRNLQGSAIKRAKLPMLQRNARIVQANHARRT